jgi:hypothetical protein
MKDLITQLLTLLVLILGGTFFLKGKIKNPFKKKKREFSSEVRPLGEPPDVEKIKEEFKNETPKQSAHRVTNMLAKLFPRN